MSEKRFLGEITVADVIDEIKREIKVRERVYPGWVKSGKIRQSCADYRCLCLKAALVWLEEIERTTAEQRSLF